MLSIKNLTVSVEGKKILRDFAFDFLPGKTYALMGPNGSGKSTLASAIMGHPAYTLSRPSKILLGRKNLKNLAPDERARLGVFLSFQTPMELAGVNVFELLRLALEKKIAPVELHTLVAKHAKELRIKDELLRRSLNVGFSGGEKKKLEALQAALLSPRFAIFDEIDTGVDVDALKTITKFLRRHLPEETTLIFITHSVRLLRATQPDQVLILKDGRLVKTGRAALAKKIEEQGFDSIK
ncbi:MAG: Fe-S cluster assembly ATPase SufC [Candidatus Moraniibacteriota bacterium]|nr:MAG: Fe-S cluster assembly ATPase SufC [Candidatus Moranbacteria bacterium]